MRLSIAFDGSTPIVDTLPLVRAAAEGGLAGVWSAEHIGLNDAVVPSAAYLTHAPSLDVGLIGCNVDTRHPAMLAMELAGLAQLGPGRVRVQVGTGDPMLARHIGVNKQQRPLETVEQFVLALRELLRGDVVTRDGPGFSLERLKLRADVVPPLIDVMAIRPRMVRLAARVGDGIALSVGASRPYLARVVESVENQVDGEGRDRAAFRITAFALCSINDDLDAARHHAAKMLSFSPPAMASVLSDGSVPYPSEEELGAAMSRGGPNSAAELFAAETVDALAFVATPATVEQRLQEYRETGIDELGMIFAGNPSLHAPIVETLSRVHAMGGTIGERAR